MHTYQLIPFQHEISPGKKFYRCYHCGWLSEPTDDPSTLTHPCPGSVHTPPPDLPDLATQLINWTVAYAQHKLSGSVDADFATILDRYRICSSCPLNLYNDILHRCCDCACVVNLALAVEKPNKLGWAESECPRGLWGSTLEPPLQQSGN